MNKKRLEVSTELARKIKEIRRLKGLTQLDFAKITDTSNSYVAHLEKGTMVPSLEFLFKIEQGLEIKNQVLSKLLIKAAWQSASNSLQSRRYSRSTPPQISPNE